MMRQRTLEDELFRFGLVFIAVGSLLLAVYCIWLKPILPAISCPFSSVLGIYCPGCGGTRAVKALLHGQIIQSFWYHPLVPYSAILGGGFMLTQGLHRLGFNKIRGWRYHNWYLIVFIFLFGCNFLIKNILRLVWGITM